MKLIVIIGLLSIHSQSMEITATQSADNELRANTERLTSEYLMVKEHTRPKQSKARVYIFNRSIEKQNFQKKNLEAEYYDLF